MAGVDEDTSREEHAGDLARSPSWISRLIKVVHVLRCLLVENSVNSAAPVSVEGELLLAFDPEVSMGTAKPLSPVLRIIA